MLKQRQPLQLIQLSSLGNEPGVFDAVIINDDLERAYEELKDMLNDVSKTLNDAFSYHLYDAVEETVGWTHKIYINLSSNRKSRRFRKNHKEEAEPSLSSAGQKDQNTLFWPEWLRLHWVKHTFILEYICFCFHPLCHMVGGCSVQFQAHWSLDYVRFSPKKWWYLEVVASWFSCHRNGNCQIQCYIWSS